MAEVYETPDYRSPEPQEVSVDTLAQEELENLLPSLAAESFTGTQSGVAIRSRSK